MVKYPDCLSDCKDSKFLVYIENIDQKIWSIDKLSILLCTIKELGYTEYQSKIVSESAITNSTKRFKIFTGDKTTSFQVLDILLNNKLSAGIYKKTEDIFK